MRRPTESTVTRVWTPLMQVPLQSTPDGRHISGTGTVNGSAKSRPEPHQVGVLPLCFASAPISVTLMVARQRATHGARLRWASEAALETRLMPSPGCVLLQRLPPQQPPRRVPDEIS